MADDSEKLNVVSQVVGSSDQMLFCYETTLDPIDYPIDVAVQSFSPLNIDREFGERDSVRHAKSHANWQAALLSTLTSLAIVLILLAAVRFLLPPMLESARYGWYRGQLRAEHEAASEHLKSVSFDGLSQISESVSKRVTPSVVHVDVRQKLDAHLNAANPSLQSLLDRENFVVQGSGVVVDTAGYILTNHHVLENADTVEVVLSDRRRVRAQVVGSDVLTDLAVLKVDADSLIPIEWGDSEQLTVGSSVWAVGSPFGLSGSITFGIVSSKHRINLRDTPYEDSKVKLRPHYGDLLQSDVAVNPGNSGGPLVDFQGKLVGINTAILGETYRGVSFSIPSRVAKRCYEQIRANGKVERGWLGVELATRPTLNSIISEVSTAEGDEKTDFQQSQPGALIQGFAHGKASPALVAGLRIGDRILEFNGTKVFGSDELIGQLGELEAGSTVSVRIKRGEKLLDLTVTLGARPVDEVR